MRDFSATEEPRTPLGREAFCVILRAPKYDRRVLDEDGFAGCELFTPEGEWRERRR